MSGSLRTQRHGPVAWVTLSHPGKFNAMSRSMWRVLRTTFEGLQQDPTVRCVVVRGEGGHFCAGGDIAEYPEFRFTTDGLRAFHEQDVWGGLQAMLACDVPIVALIEGNCMGAGLEMACCCDIRLASDDARFGAPIGRLGFPMAPREAALVLREAGAACVRTMLLEGAVLPAAHMAAQGFVHRIVAPDAGEAEARSTARRVADHAPQAARLNKQTLRALQSAELNDSPKLQALLSQAYDYADSAEHRSGIEAFLARQPNPFSIS